MPRILVALVAALFIAAPSAAQEVNQVTEFSEVAQSPPYLNCNTRVTVNHQGTAMVRGKVYIRDASATLRATGGSDDWFMNQLYVETGYGTGDGDPAGTWTCTFDGEVIFDYSEHLPLSGSQQTVVCPGERGAIRAEYIAKPTLGWVPTCDQIQQYPSDPFVHSEDTHGTWGYVNGILYLKLGQIQEYSLWWYPENVRVTSGYRCPHKNDALPGNPAPLSRHQFGDAIDMMPPVTYYSPPNQQEYDRLRSAVQQTGPTFMSNWSDYPTDRHLHADWR